MKFINIKTPEKEKADQCQRWLHYYKNDSLKWIVIYEICKKGFCKVYETVFPILDFLKATWIALYNWHVAFENTFEILAEKMFEYKFSN